MDAMTFFIFTAAAMAAFSFAKGIASMAHGGQSDALHSHEFMFKRVAWQALAALLILFALIGSA
jgi:hypothetical protein